VLWKITLAEGVMMAIYLDVVYTDGQCTELIRQEFTVRAIGEILPFVMAKFGIGHSDRHPEAAREPDNGLDYSI
jgi:hypothetical protein